MDDDLNISAVFTSLFGFVKKVNRPLSRHQLNGAERDKVLDVLKGIDAVLGIMSFEEEGLSVEASTLMRQREEMRQKSQWKEADEIRQKLSGMGVVLQDTPEGTVWRSK
jgi:cysteinyl-tRNA synthetase